MAALVVVACGGGTGQPGHTFEILDEGGVPVAVSSAVPKYEGEIFSYEKVLEIRPDRNEQEALLYEPRSMTLGDDGLFYVADNGNHRIAVFDSRGNFVRAIGSEGQGPGEMRSPVEVWVRDGVVTVRERRTTRFRTDGTFLDVLRWEGGNDDVYLSDDGRMVVMDFPQGPQEDTFHYMSARARVLDAEGEVAAVIQTGEAVRMKIVPGSIMGSATVHYTAWPRVLLRPGNEILATSGTEPLVSWYGLDGSLLRQARIELSSEPITDEDIAAVEERYDRLIDNGLRAGGDEHFRDMLLDEKGNAQYPEHKAFWSHVQIDEPSGWVWLTVPVPDFGVYVRGSPRIRQQQTLRVLSPEGELIGVTRWPPEVAQFGTKIAYGYLMAMIPDPETEEDVPTVYRIRSTGDGLVYP